MTTRPSREAFTEAYLARSSPPEVVLPECPYDGYTMHTAEYVWCKCVAEFTEALAAAGVPWKELKNDNA